MTERATGSLQTRMESPPQAGIKIDPLITLKLTRLADTLKHIAERFHQEIYIRHQFSDKNKRLSC